MAHLFDGCADACYGGQVGVRALQEAAVAADDLLACVPSHAAEGLIHIHQRTVRQVGVCNRDALCRNCGSGHMPLMSTKIHACISRKAQYCPAGSAQFD